MEWNGSNNLIGTDWDCAGSFNRSKFKKIYFFNIYVG